MKGWPQVFFTGLAIAFGLLFPNGGSAVPRQPLEQDHPILINAQNTESLSPYQKAADYSATQGGDALLIVRDDEVVFEQYAKDYSAKTPHPLMSGTASFAGIMAIAAAKDNLLDLDELLADTITEWKPHPKRSTITIRQLLTLTSGFAAGKFNEVPTYDTAVKSALIYNPGTRFEYGPVPFQIFGEVMRRKLLKKKQDPLAYLKNEVLDRIDLNVGAWQRGADGHPNLASGAVLTARDWAKLGQLLNRKGRWDGEKVLSRKLIPECFDPSPINAAYGLTFWLNALGPAPNGKPLNFLEMAPEDAFMAAGTQDQRLYVIPSKKLVIVRFGRDNSFEDREFLSLLFSQ